MAVGGVCAVDGAVNGDAVNGIVIKDFKRRDPEHLASLLSQSDGTLGFRGDFEENARGVYFGGFYDSAPIVYGEKAYGYAEYNEFMPQAADARHIGLEIDGEALSAAGCDILRVALSFDTGLLTRDVGWRLKSGAQARLNFRRIIALKDGAGGASEAAIELSATVSGARRVILRSGIALPRAENANSRDPRKGEWAGGSVVAASMGFRDGVCHVRQRAENTGSEYLAKNADELVCSGAYEYAELTDEYGVCREYAIAAEAPDGRVSFTLVKRVVYSRGGVGKTVNRKGVDDIISANRRILGAAEKRAFVGSSEAAVNSAASHAFYIMNTQAATGGETGIAAKGLTGGGYCGHCFWDTEIYLLPYYIYTDPEKAKSQLLYRHAALGHARRRARELGRPGALFAWRTISGRECSAYYPAGTAQYHINADIALAFSKYSEITGDYGFMRDFGLEVLREVSAFYLSLGFFSDSKNGAFVINCVTGPDEYNCLVNNNIFTNLSVKKTFASYLFWADRLGVPAAEREKIRAAAERMYIPVDKDGEPTQDDGFEDREPWDIDTIPRDKFPLLLHYHYLDIYRRKVCKQADLVLAMFLFGPEFAGADKAKLFDRYSAVTTHDSSLSKAAFAIEAAELGRAGEAYRLFRDVCLADFENTHNNTQDGLHMANLGGVWNTLVYGFAGMRDEGGRLSFAPALPPEIEKIGFGIRVRGRAVNVEIRRNETEYRVDGGRLEITHCGKEVCLENVVVLENKF